MSDFKKDRRSREERDEQRDRFWDLGSMLPQKKSVTPVPRTTPKIELPDIVVHSDPSEISTHSTQSLQLSFDTPVKIETGVEPLNREATDRPGTQFETVKRFIPPHTGEQFEPCIPPIKEYFPKNTMIHKVSLYAWTPRYSYYDRFAAVALTLYNKTLHTPCDPVDFFSYVPNYAQLSREQLSWYIYWRTRMHEGEYCDVSYSYILLYVYELLAVVKELGADTVRERMIAVWSAYRQKHNKLDKFMGDWICDLSLIYELPAPTLFKPLFEAVMQNCTLKEYYIPDRGNDYCAYADIIVKYCSSYDYTKSKFYKDSSADLYDKHIHKAIELVMQKFSDSGKLFSAIGLTDSHMKKDTFVGAVCTCEIKRKIEVDYCSFSGTNDLRHAVGDMVKCCENRLRAYLGIKSRFSAVPLHPDVRKAIDYYFDTELPGTGSKVQNKKQREEAVRESAYSHLYDVPKSEFSAEKAMSIELESWKTTELLTEAFEDDASEKEFLDASMPSSAISEEPLVLQTDAMSSSDTEQLALTDISDDLKEFLVYAYLNDGSAQREYAKRTGSLIDTVAERVNEFALEAIGDIVIEDNGDGIYTVIEDYRDTVRIMIKNYKPEMRMDND